MRITKRDFLVGAGAAVAGTGAFAGGRWVWGQVGAKPPAAEPEGKQTSFAQSGEDLVISFLFEYLLSLAAPTYLDIGAWHPTIHNNTFLFYQRGARGVLVEPNDEYCRLLTDVRPGDAILCAGVGTGAGTEADYYMLTGSGLNTFSKEQAERVEQSSKGRHRILKVVKKPLLNINDVIAKHFAKAPDLVSVDVEGLDLAILKSLDFARYRPRVFCVETLVVGTSKYVPEVGEFLADHGYVARGMTVPNTIFVDKKLVDS